jgi:hypothetical protein
LNVKSHALKRELAREIGIRYKDQNVFTKFAKTNDIFTVNKFKARKNEGGPILVRGIKPGVSIEEVHK